MTPSTDARRRPISASRTAGAGLAALTGLALVIAVGASLTGCGGTADRGQVRLGDVAGATPRAEPKARYGNMRSYVVFGKTYYPKKTSRNHTERGIASWYGPKFHGKKTSSGEIYDMHRMTAAHKTLPLPTYALVTNLENGRDLIVRINDRGPFVGDRIIDLSYAAAKHLGVDKQGTAMVQVTSVDPRDHDGEIPKTIALAKRELGRNRARSAGSGTETNARVNRTEPRVAGTGTQPATRSTEPALEPSPAAAPAQPPAAAVTLAGGAVEPVVARPAAAQTAGGYSLQIGAFGTRANAEQMRRELQGKLSAPVTIDSRDDAATAGGVLYRVRVGPVGSRPDAERLSEQLLALGVGASMVVPH